MREASVKATRISFSTPVIRTAQSAMYKARTTKCSIIGRLTRYARPDCHGATCTVRTFKGIDQSMPVTADLEHHWHRVSRPSNVVTGYRRRAYAREREYYCEDIRLSQAYDADGLRVGKPPISLSVSRALYRAVILTACWGVKEKLRELECSYRATEGRPDQPGRDRDQPLS